MKIILEPPLFLTDPTDRYGVLLTLLFFAFFPLHALCANDSNVGFVADSQRYNNAIEYTEEHAERGVLTSYIRQQVLNSTPTLPDEIRSTARWALSGFNMGHGLLNFGFSSIDDETGTASDTHAVAQLVQSASPTDDGSPWLASTTYHHRNGFLPTHDAMMFGSHSKSNLADGYMQFDVHPYVGQSWMSANNYYGADISLNLASPADTSRTTKPWGKIVLS